MMKSASIIEVKRDYGVKIGPGVFPEGMRTVIRSTKINRCLLVNPLEGTDIFAVKNSHLLYPASVEIADRWCVCISGACAGQEVG